MSLWVGGGYELMGWQGLWAYGLAGAMGVWVGGCLANDAASTLTGSPAAPDNPHKVCYTQ